MAAIKEDWGRGQRELDPIDGAEPTAATVLRDIADDLGTLQIPTITSPDATDLASAQTLVNEIKNKLNAIAAAAIKTTKA